MKNTDSVKRNYSLCAYFDLIVWFDDQMNFLKLKMV